MSDLSSRYLTSGQVARKIGVSRWTLHRWIKAGEFPKGQRVGQGWQRWPRRQVEAWVAERAN